MNKVTLLIASTALAVSVVALLQKTAEVQLNLAIMDALKKLDSEIQFAKIVEHLEGDN